MLDINEIVSHRPGQKCIINRVCNGFGLILRGHELIVVRIVFNAMDGLQAAPQALPLLPWSPPFLQAQI
jgi:hypothetical protein